MVLRTADTSISHSSRIHKDWKKILSAVALLWSDPHMQTIYMNLIVRILRTSPHIFIENAILYKHHKDHEHALIYNASLMILGCIMFPLYSANDACRNHGTETREIFIRNLENTSQLNDITWMNLLQVLVSASIAIPFILATPYLFTTVFHDAEVLRYCYSYIYIYIFAVPFQIGIASLQETLNNCQQKKIYGLSEILNAFMLLGTALPLILMDVGLDSLAYAKLSASFTVFCSIFIWAKYRLKLFQFKINDHQYFLHDGKKAWQYFKKSFFSGSWRGTQTFFESFQDLVFNIITFSLASHNKKAMIYLPAAKVLDTIYHLMASLLFSLERSAQNIISDIVAQDRKNQIIKNSGKIIAVGWVINALVISFCFGFHENLIKLFYHHSDSNIQNQINTLVKTCTLITGGTYLLDTLVATLSGGLNGMGMRKIPSMVTLVLNVITCFAAYLLTQTQLNFMGVFIAEAIGLLFITALLLPDYLNGRKIFESTQNISTDELNTQINETSMFRTAYNKIRFCFSGAAKEKEPLLINGVLPTYS